MENSTYSFPIVIQIMSENKDLYKIQGQGIFVVCQLIPVRMAGHKTTLFPKPEAWESLSDFLNLHFQSVCYFSPLSMSSSLSHKPVATAIITKSTDTCFPSWLSSPWSFPEPSPLPEQNRSFLSETPTTAWGLCFTMSVYSPVYVGLAFRKQSWVVHWLFYPCTGLLAHSQHRRWPASFCWLSDKTSLNVFLPCSSIL